MGAAALVVLVALVVGCGDDSNDKSTTAAEATTTQTTTQNKEARKNGPVPASLRTIESASEDIIDLALAGKRAEVVQKAEKLKAAAEGPAAKDLAKAGVPDRSLNKLKARAERVAKLAPSARLLDVALASNQAFALVPNYFARYETKVPSSITELDYLDFQIKLEAKAGDVDELLRALVGLQATWDSTRPDIPDARAAARYDAHVEAIRRLGAHSDPEEVQREAQHGLDLVDVLEESFGGG